MRHGLALVVALCGGLLVGCFTAAPTRTLSLYGRRPTFEGPTGADVVHLLVALIERPVGDHAINQEIWQLADEQSVDLEHKVVLHDNGLRMGQFGSCPPASLNDMIRSHRSCLNPKCISMRAGNPTTVLLGPTQPHFSFQLVDSDQTTTIDLDQAQCQLQVTPTLTKDGKTRLEFAPCIRHGQPSMTPRPIQDPGGTLRWNMMWQKPTESYAQLNWQQTVCDSDWVVIGTFLDKQGTLGQRCFIETEMPPPVQRLLVLRALRTGQDNLPPEDCLSKSPSIAAQASQTTVRGTPP
jgi:hypothetical protein